MDVFCVKILDHSISFSDCLPEPNVSPPLMGLHQLDGHLRLDRQMIKEVF